MPSGLTMFFKPSLSVVIFCVVTPSIIESRVLTSPIITVEFSVFPLDSDYFLPHKLGGSLVSYM